jgi:hypothetical protein
MANGTKRETAVLDRLTNELKEIKLQVCGSISTAEKLKTHTRGR